MDAPSQFHSAQVTDAFDVTYSNFPCAIVNKSVYEERMNHRSATNETRK